jgi:hypothetical protein
VANICTTFARVVWGAHDRGGVSDDALVEAVLGEGESYCMPLHLEHLRSPIADPGPSMFTDITYGARGTPGGGPEDLWRLVAGAADSVWFRWFDGGGDWDFIESIDAVGRSPLRLCRYGFDAVRAGGETIAIAGSYLTGHHRADLGAPRRAPVGRVAPANAARWAEAPDAELLWDGRIVHRRGEASAGWESCVDPDFRVAMGAPDWIDASVADEDARRWTR